MPDMQFAAELKTELRATKADLTTATQNVATLTGEIAALRNDLQAATARIAGLETALADAAAQTEAMQASRSWRFTAGLRRIEAVMRGF
jgi:hypothetical protein